MDVYKLFDTTTRQRKEANTPLFNDFKGKESRINTLKDLNNSANYHNIGAYLKNNRSIMINLTGIDKIPRSKIERLRLVDNMINLETATYNNIRDKLISNLKRSEDDPEYLKLEAFIKDLQERYDEALRNGEYLHLIERDIHKLKKKRHMITQEYINKLLYKLSDWDNPYADFFSIEGSDAELLDYILEDNSYIDDFEFKTYKMNNRGDGGGFFPFINKSNIDLSRLQIFDKEQLKKLNVIDNCLVSSLKELNLSKSKLSKLIFMISENNNVYISKRNLKNISKALDITIHLEDIGEDYKVKYVLYNNGFETYNICLFMNHFFPKITIETTNYHIDNIDSSPIDAAGVRSKTGKFIRDRKRFLSSNLVVIKLSKLGYFEYDNDLNKINTKIVLDDTLNNLDDYQSLVKINHKKTEKLIYYADSEALIEGFHKPFLIGYVSEDKDEVKIVKTITDMFDDMIKSPFDLPIVIYFHNLKYDYSILLNEKNIPYPTPNYKYIRVENEISKEGQLYSVKISYKKKKIELRDSLKHCNLRLSQFQTQYELPADICKKSCDIYELYTEENIKLSKVGLDLLKQHTDNLDDFKDFTNDKYFFHMDFYKYYLKYDCLTLKYGFLKHREAIMKITKLDIHDFLTTASIANQFMFNQGVYNNVYSVSGPLLNFISKACIGGRVCMMNNERQNVRGAIADLDAVSLYPSALTMIQGYPKGKAKLIKNKDSFECIFKSNSYYIVEIRLTNINKKQQIPFLCVNQRGIRKYSNNVEDYTEPIVVDKIALEDFIKFHDIEYKFIRGVFYDKGYNCKIGKAINKLFNDRKAAKDRKDSMMDKTIKLLMNSSYGKNLLKSSKTNIRYFNSKQKKNFIIKNHNNIQSIEKIGNDIYRAKQTVLDFNHSNTNHCGAICLSMSKRIMNEVMDIANELGYQIYYQDTDSMHIPKKYIEPLRKEYRKRYNKELLGNDLGQFNSDLIMKVSIEKYNKLMDITGGEHTKNIMFLEAMASRHISIGKKVYYDLITPTINLDDYDNLIDETLISEHIRYKGVSTEAIKRTAAKNNITTCELYENIYSGEAYEAEQNTFNTKIGVGVRTEPLKRTLRAI